MINFSALHEKECKGCGKIMASARNRNYCEICSPKQEKSLNNKNRKPRRIAHGQAKVRRRNEVASES